MVQQILRCYLLITLPIGCAAIVHGQETGTLRARFVHGGVAPEAEKINVNKDIEFCGRFPLTNESLIVDKKNLGIKNVVFYVFTGRRGSKLEAVERTPKTVTLAIENCRFEPHILCMQAGDTLNIVQRDRVGHNANLNLFANSAYSEFVPPGGPQSIKLEKAEPAPIPIDCNIHPWMRAYLVVLDHPFVSVSDDQGNIEIKDLPAGNELVFRMYHESSLRIPELEIDGRKVATDRNLIRLMIKPGMNDLGSIVIPSDLFGRN
jgi:plastocyanin